MASSRSVVLAALIANGAITVLKFLGYLLTASPAMLSETYHSLSDTGNQVFLLVGIRFGEQAPNARHPFGYGKAQFFYSFLVSVLLFGIAGWESANHGWHALQHGGRALGGATTLFGYTFPATWVNYAVLGGAFVFETWALLKANAGLRSQMDEWGWSGYVEAFRKTSDVTTLTAFTEDAIALAGVTLAFVGILATELTGNAIYDAGAALLIGLMLMGFALALAWQNKRLLLGESLPEDRLVPLRAVFEDAAVVEELLDLRTVYFGPEKVLMTADVAFDPDVPAGELESRIDDIEATVRATDAAVERIYVEPERRGPD